MTTSALRSALLCLLPAMAVCALDTESTVRQDQPAPEVQESKEEKAVQVQYLEIVTPDVDAMCGTLEKLHGVSFSDPVAEFGNARTAALEGGGLIGVRAPMRADEAPRGTAVRCWSMTSRPPSRRHRAAGAVIAHAAHGRFPASLGTFAIYIQGGIQHGLWQI